MQDIFEHKNHFQIENDSAYMVAYPHIISHFKAIHTLTKTDFIILIHAVYGWMPTILKHHAKSETDIDDAVIILNKANNENQFLEDIDYVNLQKYIHNSLVGTSKALHFIAPHKYPIWDSKIFKYIHSGEIPYQYRINDPKRYIAYIKILNEHINDPRFPKFYKEMKEDVKYDISEYRALELAMFQKIRNDEKAQKIKNKK